MAQASVSAAGLGFANGRIPASFLASVGYGQYMEPHAAAQLLAALADMAAHGYSIPITEGYRSYDTQVQLRNLYLNGNGNVAAVPGTSNHGDGRAVDLGGAMTSWSTSAQAYWGQIEATYGYSSVQGRADGEPWHKVCTTWLDNITYNIDGGFLMALTEEQQQDVYNKTQWIYTYLAVPNAGYGFPQANNNAIGDVAKRLLASDKDGKPLGYDWFQAINNNIVGLYALLRQEPTAGAAITDAQVQQIADSLKQGLGADVAAELSKRLAA